MDIAFPNPPTMILEYKLLLSRFGPDQLSDQVNEHLRQGWSIYGNPVVTMAQNTGTVYAQAVTIWRVSQ